MDDIFPNAIFNSQDLHFIGPFEDYLQLHYVLTESEMSIPTHIGGQIPNVVTDERYTEVMIPLRMILQQELSKLHPYLNVGMEGLTLVVSFSLRFLKDKLEIVVNLMFFKHHNALLTHTLTLFMTPDRVVCDKADMKLCTPPPTACKPH